MTELFSRFLTELQAYHAELAAALGMFATLALVGCAMLKPSAGSVSDAAYVATKAYLGECSSLDQGTRDAVSEAYAAFKKGTARITPGNAENFPALLKEEYTSRIPDAAARERVDRLIDMCWARVKAVVAMSGMTPGELYAMIAAIQAGIDRAVAEASAKQ